MLIPRVAFHICLDKFDKVIGTGKHGKICRRCTSVTDKALTQRALEPRSADVGSTAPFMAYLHVCRAQISSTPRSERCLWVRANSA